VEGFMSHPENTSDFGKARKVRELFAGEVSEWTINEWARQGKLPGVFKPSPKVILFNLPIIKAWISAGCPPVEKWLGEHYPNLVNDKELVANG
jgi:hypothetical protein